MDSGGGGTRGKEKVDSKAKPQVKEDSRPTSIRKRPRRGWISTMMRLGKDITVPYPFIRQRREANGLSDVPCHTVLAETVFSMFRIAPQTGNSS